MRFVAVVLVALVILAASPLHAAEPVKIGYLGPQSGIFAPAGKDMLEGLKMALDQAGYQAGGRKVELIDEDSEGNPATAQAKYRKLVSQDKIHALAGVLLSNIGYALVPPIERDRMPSLFLTTPDDLTKRKPSKYILRSNFAASQPMHALGDYAAKTLKYKRVAAVAMDNPFGHEQIGGFQRVFEDAGGKVVQKLWVPLKRWTSRRSCRRCRATSTRSCRSSSPARRSVSRSTTVRARCRGRCRSSAAVSSATSRRSSGWATR